MKRKVIATVLIAVMAVSVYGCGTTSDDASNVTEGQNVTEQITGENELEQSKETEQIEEIEQEAEAEQIEVSEKEKENEAEEETEEVLFRIKLTGTPDYQDEEITLASDQPSNKEYNEILKLPNGSECDVYEVLKDYYLGDIYYRIKIDNKEDYAHLFYTAENSEEYFFVLSEDAELLDSSIDITPYIREF